MLSDEEKRKLIEQYSFGRDINAFALVAEVERAVLAKASQQVHSKLYKWYVKLTNADSVQDGENVNGKHCTDEMLLELEYIIASAIAMPAPKQEPVGITDSAGNLKIYKDKLPANTAIYAAPPQAAIPESWRVTKAGQIKVGDVISMVMAGRRICTSAKEVLSAGTDREEIVYNRKKNHYFITSMVLDGTSNHKEVFIIPVDS